MIMQVETQMCLQSAWVVTLPMLTHHDSFSHWCSKTQHLLRAAPQIQWCIACNVPSWTLQAVMYVYWMLQCLQLSAGFNSRPAGCWTKNLSVYPFLFYLCPCSGPLLIYTEATQLSLPLVCLGNWTVPVISFVGLYGIAYSCCSL